MTNEEKERYTALKFGDGDFARRYKMLTSMHNIMLCLNDEYAYDEWVTIEVPDEPTADDFMDIAEDEGSYREAVCEFTRIFNKYVEEE